MKKPKVTPFTQMRLHIDRLHDIESGVQSNDEFHRVMAANKDEIDAIRAYIREQGRAMTSIEIMRSRMIGLINFGHEYRSPGWISIMRAVLNKGWSDINGWQP